MTLWQKINTPLSSYQRDAVLFYILFALFGLGALIYGLASLAYSQYFYANAKTTEGVVTAHINDGRYPAGIGRKGGLEELLNPRIFFERTSRLLTDEDFYLPVISYSVGDAAYSLRAGPLSTIYIEDRWPLDKRVTIYYLPSNPAASKIRNYDYEWNDSIRWIVPGALLTLTLLGGHKKFLRRWEKKK